MNNLKDLSAKVAQTLDTMLPKNVRCVIVLVDTTAQDVCAVSDLPDDQARALLVEAVDVLGDSSLGEDLDIKPLN